MSPVSLPLSSYRSLVSLDDARAVVAEPDWAGALGEVTEQLGIELPPPGDPAAHLDLVHQHLAHVDPFTLADSLVDLIERINVAAANERDPVIALDLPTLAEAYGPGVDYPAADAVSLVVADITRLDVDAIVNAANTYLLGCRVPGHACIDNAIHSGAGPRLRDDCAAIIAAQGHLEPVGAAKVTRGHALPSRYVLHTVGPQLVRGAQPTEPDRRALANCYRSCLDAAAEVEAIRAVAFCAISTGVFAFPSDQAAEIALATIAAWVEARPSRFDRIVIDCFSERDAHHYIDALGAPR